VAIAVLRQQTNGPYCLSPACTYMIPLAFVVFSGLALVDVVFSLVVANHDQLLAIFLKNKRGA